MGMFSWDCPACQHSIRATGATTLESHWMSEAVAVLDNGARLVGEYDGYGRIGRSDLDAGDNFTLYHKACWHLSGKPGYTKDSPSAHDQGYFVGEYDPSEPKSEADLEGLRQVGQQKREANRQMWQKVLGG